MMMIEFIDDLRCSTRLIFMEEATAIIDLMRRMLVFRPEERPTVEDILQSEWMVKWALPELKRSSQTK